MLCINEEYLVYKTGRFFSAGNYFHIPFKKLILLELNLFMEQFLRD